MDLTSFMKTAVYKVFLIVTIATVVFSTLGIQPASASSTISLSPVDQMNVQKDSNGNLLTEYKAPDIMNVAYKANMIDFVALKFGPIDTSKSILSAQLTLYGINQDSKSSSNLTVKIGNNSWDSNSQGSEFPNFMQAEEGITTNVTSSDGSEIYQKLIDVTNLVKNASAISGDNVTFILTSDSSEMTVVKFSSSMEPELAPLAPSLKITYGDAHVQNSPPTDIKLDPATVEENQPTGTTVGTLSATDPDAGETLTYSLVAGQGDTNNSSFSIYGDQLKTESMFDYETNSSYSVRIRVTDKGGLFYEKEFTISVIDVNEDPIPILLSTAPVNNATDVSINPTLSLTFSENVEAVEGKNIRIYDQNDNLIESIEATNATVNGSMVSIQPTNTLLKGKTYYVLMDNGAFMDTANQGIAGITSTNTWRFTTLSPSDNAYLSNLVISSGNLNPNFTDSTVNYQVNVAYNVENIDIAPTTANSSATLTLNGTSIASGLLSTIPLNVGSNTITIVVTAENGVATKTYTLTVIRALPTLEQVDNVALSTSGIATWTDIAGESSYAVQLFKGGSPIGSVVDISADTTTHNFLPTMRAAGVGAYTVTVKAKGDGLAYLDGVPSIHSNTQTIIKLASITNGLSWDGNIAKWQAIPNAVSYDVLLYKEGAAVGTATNVLAGNINEGFDFTTAFQTNGVGSYTFTVQPKGDELLILDGGQGVSSAAKIISPLTYTVLYDGNGSTGGTIPQDNATYSQNDDVTVAVNDGYLVKTGHSFIGWNTKADGTGTSYLPNNTFKIATENVTLFAQWAINHYTVSFDVAGGSAVSNQMVEHGDKASQPTLEPIKAGHTFGGWYTSGTGNTPFSFDTAITGDTVVYAKWNPVTYTVSFDVGGGSAVSSQTITYGEKATEPTPEPTKDGYTFGGWYTSGTGNTPFSFDTAITGDATVYAKWSPMTYTVSFDVGGGSVVTSQSIAYGEKATEPTPVPTKANYIFGGWYTSGTGDKPFNFSNGITEDTIVYAKWNPMTYMVSFNVDGGSVVNSQTIISGEKVTEPTPAPTKAGHTFDGWYTSGAYTTTYDFDSVITADTTIYAKWNPLAVTHTVSFDVAGGSAISNQTVAHEGKASQPTPTPTKAGHTFGGWYTSNAYTTPYNFDTAITANTVIYAKWISSNTGGGNTDPSPNPDSGSSTPSTNVEEIVVDVESGDGDLVSKTTIKRTKNVDNTINDEVTLTAESATETIRKLKEQGNDKARIIIPDQQDQVNQVHVSIPKNVVTLLKNGAVHLEIVTDNVRIEVPKTSLEMFNDNLYFRLVPIKGQAEQLDIKEQAKKERVVQQLAGSAVVELLGRPMTIETNMQSRPVTLTLPLPTDLTQEQLDHLAIYIEHSDGTKEVVYGKIVEFQKGIAGLQFVVNKFSTFSILYLPEKEEVTELITDAVTNTPYIKGYQDGAFRPNAPVTRAQMASMFARQLTGNEIPQAKATYTDTLQHDAKDAIEFAKEKGLFKGVTTTNFNPNGLITRAQMATVAARWIEEQCVNRPNVDFCQPTSQSVVLKDVSLNHWAVKAIDTVSKLGIMTGMTADTFNPDGYVTRAQAVKVLNRLFERQVTKEHQNPTFTDVPSTHWAFYEIQEAAQN
ncbi:InlB B-repeat-containing protein [Lysinibacillus cavernae]|uniref:InlB B-repeat-containing protein n=1 Tax=Lysinibacillus cavernae TaxID=2666135 RepID=UPI0012D89E88|nr:InlB B-repeat-containing protein [Lysinibacillus cavernae]